MADYRAWAIEQALAENIGFRLRGNGYTLHLWVSEVESRTLTRAERKAVVDLLGDGTLRWWHNPSNFSRGLVEVRR